MSADRPAASDGGPRVSRTRRVRAGRRSRPPPIALHVCVLTRAPWRRRPGRCMQFRGAHHPATSTDCPAASDGVGGDSQVHHPGADRPLRFHGRPLPRPFCDVSGAPLPAMSIDRWGPRITRERRQGPAVDRPPPSRRPRSRYNSDHAGKRYVLGPK